MSKQDRLTYAALNQMVTGEKFKDPDEFIYGSLTQPPLKVLEKHNTDDEMEWTVECPNCGSRANYGREVFMISGHFYCAAKNCRRKLIEKLEGEEK